MRMNFVPCKSDSNIEASADVTVSLLQTNKTNNNHKTVKGLLDTGALSTFVKKRSFERYFTHSETY